MGILFRKYDFELLRLVSFLGLQKLFILVGLFEK
jgi:hypothetical protein